jgi:hypothetical protein
MAQAETNQVKLLISEESTWGEDPSTPTMQITRWTGGSLAHEKDTEESATLRSDRMTDDIVEVAARAGGDLNMELTFGLDATPDPAEFGHLCEGVFGADFVQGSESSKTIDVVASTGTFTGTGTGWDTAGLLPGMFIKFDGLDLGAAGTVMNKGPHQVATVVSDTVLTVVDNTPLADESGNADEGWDFNCLRNGTSKKSFLFELEFGDIASTFLNYRGMRATRMELNISAGAIVGVTFGFMGKGGYYTAATVGDGSPTAAGTTSSYNATENVGTLLEGGSALASATRSATISIDNQGRALQGIGDKYAIGINYGRQRVTGTLESYFESTALLAKFINHTETALVIPLTDAADNNTIISVPSAYYTEGNPNVPGGDDEVIQPLAFAARREQTNQLYQVQLDLLPAY